MPTLASNEIALRAELRIATRVLTQAGVISARWDAELMLAHVRGCSRAALYLQESVPESVRDRFWELVERRRRGEPLQYCTGHAWFYGLALRVGPGAFIPRQETEVLVDEAIKILTAYARPVRVIDLCCGPGSIGISLTKNVPECRITAIDQSDAALAYARENAVRHGVTEYITFVRQDIGSSEEEIARVPRADMIVCNPPYIPSAECRKVPAEVLHEPRAALDGGEDGLFFYRRVIPRWHQAVTDGGTVMVEHGDGQGPAVHAIMRQSCGYRDIVAIADLTGRERVVKACVSHG